MPSEPLCIPAGNPGSLTGRGNNTWLIDGAEPTLVDAGIGTATHLAAITRALGSRSLVRVLLTHGHDDHAAGVPALRSSWPSIDVCKHALHGESGSRALLDGDMVRAGDITLRAIHTPGHAPDHLCFWDADRRVLYAGDMVQSGTTVMIPAGRGGSLRDYLASLERLAALGPVRIYPGHGDVIEQPIQVITGYLEHRRRREQQILQSLAAGDTDPEAIVRRVYPDLADGLKQAAVLTVEAHLQKLRDEGRIP